MSNDKTTKKNEQGTITAQKAVKSKDIKFSKRNCTDCLYCKVSANSSGSIRMCFCSMSKEKERDLETNWKTKKVCKKFFDMC